MYLPILLTSLLALAVSAIPLSAHAARDVICEKPSQCLRILSLNTSMDSANQINFRFALQYGHDTFNESTSCSASWQAGSNGWPANYINCDNEDYRWSFSKFDSLTEWHMEATHEFVDDGYGGRYYANGTACSADFDCEGPNDTECSLRAWHVVNLLFYAAVL